MRSGYDNMNECLSMVCFQPQGEWVTVCCTTERVTVLYVCSPKWLYEWLTMDCFMVCLQVDGTGNCLFLAIKRSLSVRTATSWEATYFPNSYFRRIVVNCMVNHQQLIYNIKFLALMSLYGIEEWMDPSRGWNPPLLFKQYLRLLLQRDFWGDEVVLHAISCMWSMKITVLNMKNLQEYRIRHDMVMEKADVIITYNAVNHFNASGMYGWTYEWLSERVTVFALYLWTSDIPSEWLHLALCWWLQVNDQMSVWMSDTFYL